MPILESGSGGQVPDPQNSPPLSDDDPDDPENAALVRALFQQSLKGTPFESATSAPDTFSIADPAEDFQEFVAEQRAREEQGLLEGFGRDAFRAMKGVLTSQLTGPSFTPLGSQIGPILEHLFRGEQEEVSKAENEAIPVDVLGGSDPNPISVFRSAGAAGFARGTTFGLEGLPGVGEYIKMVVDPLQHELDRQAHQQLTEVTKAMDSKLGDALFGFAPQVAGMGTGVLSGSVVPFYPFVKGGTFLLKTPAAVNAVREGASIGSALKSAWAGGHTILGSSAGFALFGAATGEPSLVQAGSEMVFDKSLPQFEDDPTDAWYERSAKKLGNRMAVGSLMGLEGLAIGTVLTTGAIIAKGPEMRASGLHSLEQMLLKGRKVNPEDISAWKQITGMFVDDARRAVRLTNADDVRMISALKSYEELVQGSESGMRSLVESASAEGVVSYQSYLASVARGMHEITIRDHATHGIIRDVIDPYRMFQDLRAQRLEVAQRAARQAGISVERTEITGRGDFLVDVTDSPVQARSMHNIVGPDGEDLGRIKGILTDQNHLDVTVFEGAQGGPNNLGPSKIRDIGRQLVEDLRSAGHDIQTIGGMRLTGARPQNAETRIPVERLERISTEEVPVGLTERLPRQERTPLVHSPDDIPEEAVFGYHVSAGSQGGLESGSPIWLSTRPNTIAAERGRVNEIVVLPGKSRSFPTWDAALEKFGGVDDMIQTLRRRNVDTVIIERGGGGVRETLVLDNSVVKSTRPITEVEAQKAIPDEITPEMVMEREMANAPIEVSLAKQAPEFTFQVVKNKRGRYDVVFWPRGGQGVTGQKLSQLKSEGFFNGQHVMYGGKLYEYAGASKTGKTITLHDPVTGENMSGISKSSITDWPTARVEMDVDEALFREFRQFFEQRLIRLHELQVDEAGLRNMIASLDEPAAARRDIVQDRIDMVFYPEERLAPVEVNQALQERFQKLRAELTRITREGAAGEDLARAQELQGEMQNIINEIRNSVARDQAVGVRAEQAAAGERAQTVREGDVRRPLDPEDPATLVAFPDPLDYYNVAFRDFMRSRGIEATYGEMEALRHNFMRRLNRELFDELPKAMQERFKGLQDELIEAWEALPNDPLTKARKLGFDVIQLKNDQGFALMRPGARNIEGVYADEETLRAAIDFGLRHANAPNMSPQTNWVNFSLPIGNGYVNNVGRTVDALLDGEKGDVMAAVLSRQKSVPIEWSKTKPKWLLQIEEMTDLPIYSEYAEPLFDSIVRADNQMQPFVERNAKIFSGMKPVEKRTEIAEFLRSVESHTDFVNRETLGKLAKEFGLDEGQVSAVQEMRDLMDDLFIVGSDFFGFEPVDYIFQYYTRMLPRNLQRQKVAGDKALEELYGFLPKRMDIFMSKYTRTGQLAQVETDPFQVLNKYIRTMFWEKHVAQPYEKMTSMVDMTIGDLPASARETIMQNMSPIRRRRADNSTHALPSSVRGPLKEMLMYLRGNLSEVDSSVMNGIRAAFDKLGVSVDNEVLRTAANTAMMWHYGAALGWRPRPVVRNTYQNLMTLYPRVGARPISEGYQKAWTQEGLEEAVSAGWVDLRARGFLHSEEMVQQVISELPIETRGAKGWAVGGALRSLMIDGRLARGIRYLGERGLLGISYTDTFNRIWAGHSQVAYTRPYVEKFLQGKIGETKLLNEGLRFWEDGVRNNFMEVLEANGSQAALNYIGKRAADMSNFIYSSYANPAFMQSAVGRMFMQYGTWALNFKDMTMRSFRNARTTGDYARLMARYGMATAAITGVGLKFGVDMSSWLAHNAVLQYGGGPAAQMAVDLNNWWTSPAEYKVSGAGRMVYENFIRTMLPGQLLFDDVKESLKQLPHGEDRFLSSFLLGRPSESLNSFDRIWESQGLFPEEPNPTADLFQKSLRQNATEQIRQQSQPQQQPPQEQPQQRRP